jgi:beta-glucosidase
MDTSKTPAQRARLLLKASTLDQELRWLDEQAANNPTQTSFGPASAPVSYPAQVPCTPTVAYSDGPDYVRGPAGVTVFPAQIALAATWNEQLAYAKGAAQADEAFNTRRNVLLAPGVASGRTPLSGRTPEYLGEDPLLGGDLAAAVVDGIQNGTPQDEAVMATLKHYVGNEQELDRQTSSSNIDGRTLREVYDAPFRIAIAKGNPGSVMCSYNQVNGVYACENAILNNLLKGDDGFQGYVMSDFGAVHSTGPSLYAGLDQELNRPRFYTPQNIGAALDAGQVTRGQIDEAAFRVVRSYIANGLFDHPLPATASTSASTPEHKAIAQGEVEQGSVLLKNADSILPLAGSKKVALIGQTVSNTPTAMPNPNGSATPVNVSAGTVCAEGGFGGGFGVGGAACPNPVAPLDAITTRAASAGGSVVYDNGADPAAAAAAAKSADVAVVFVLEKQGEGADHPLKLDLNGDALISAVAAANPDTVVVLETGTAVTMPWLSDVKGVVEAWYPGDQQGTALARLLYGDVNFTGKLPMTFPKSEADLPTNTPQQYPGVFSNGSTTRPAGSTEIRQVSYSEGLAVGYKWYDSQNKEPLFPFGFGLSYTSFRYDSLAVKASGRPEKGNQQLKVSFRVRNGGTVAGTETSQVYLTLPSATGEPGKRLVGYARASLKPGERQTVTVTVSEKSADLPLSYYDTSAHAWQTAAGTYTVQVGSSSRDLPLSSTFPLG